MKARNPSTGTLDTVYVKALDSMPVGTIVDFDGDTIPTGWEEVNDYSTTEIDTGKKWINGKPIYRKCYNITDAISANTEKTFGSDTNIDVIICIYGVMTRSNGNDFQINSYDGQNYCFVRIDRATNHSFLIKSSLAGTGAFVVTEYTKSS